jgi:hypothetical protein
MFPVRHELGFYMPEDSILHSHYRENLKSCILIYLFQPYLCNSGNFTKGYIIATTVVLLPTSVASYG